MKLYTKRGDQGQTDLFSGKRIAKDALRVEAYGSVDELNASIGLALATACDHPPITNPLTQIQSRLFDSGADLATPPTPDTNPGEKPASRISPQHIAQLEAAIDTACQPLPPLKAFILPGGSELAARLHFARTVCRRAERHTVALARAEPVDDNTIIYLNRLSDLLFALARLANHHQNIPDIPWQSESKT